MLDRTPSPRIPIVAFCHSGHFIEGDIRPDLVKLHQIDIPTNQTK
jgi:hypothetical protein